MNTTTPPNNHSHKEFILMMAALMSVVAFSVDGILPALGAIREYFHTTEDNQAQLVISFFFIGLATGQLVFGPLSDALGRKNILFFCLGICLIGSVLCLNARSIEMLLIGRIIQGLGAAGPYISCMSIIRDQFSGRTMARIMSLVMMIFIMVPVIAPALGQAIIFVASWQYIFVVYIIYTLAIALWVALRLKETLPVQKRVPLTLSNLKKDIRIILTNRQTMCYTLCIALIFAALIGDLNSVQQIFQVQYGVGEMFVVYFGLQALSFGGASLMNSRWVEHYGMRYICFRALLIIAILSVLFVAIQLIVGDIPFWLFFAFGVVILFCVGLLFGNLNSLALEPMGNIAGIAAAIIGALSNAIAIPLGTMIGQYYDGTLLPLLLGFSILSTGAIILLKLAEPAQR